MAPAYVLPASAVAGSDAVNFPGFPGMWTPGQPVAVSELIAYGGFADAAEVAARVAELGLPLEQADVASGDGLMPLPANRAASETGVVPAAEEPAPPRARRRGRVADDEAGS